MIKKITAYSFLISAYIFLLAHAVIPHHHHQQLVCVESEHCSEDGYAHLHESSEHNHHHDGTNSENCCFLNQTVVVTLVQSKLSNSCDRCSDNHHHDFITLVSIGFDELYSSLVVASSPPEISFTITSYVTRTLGLRAPPVV